MSLRVWLPLTNDLKNYGSSDLIFTAVDNYSSIDNAGKLGKCYYNNSNDSGHTLGGAISNRPISLGQKQSMFCWFKFVNLSAPSALGGCMITQHRYPTNSGMGLTLAYIDGTHGRLSANTGNGSSRTYNTYVGSTILVADTWYHGGYTYDGSTLRFYLNGVLDGEYTVPNMSVPSDYLVLACWSLNNSSGATIYNNYKFYGRLNDVRIYDHCLSEKEIKEIAKGLIVHYPLNGGPRVLPPEYQELEYIESAGNAWINTGITFNLDTDAFKVICKGNNTSNNGMILASYSGRYTWLYYYNAGGTIRLYADGGNGQETAGGTTGVDLQKHIFVYENRKFYANGTQLGTLSNSYAYDDNQLYIFSRGGDYPFIGRIYHVSLKRNGILHKLYVPAKRLSDSVAGMYVENFYLLFRVQILLQELL